MPEEFKQDLIAFELRFKSQFDHETGKAILEAVVELVKDAKEALGVEIEIVGIKKPNLNSLVKQPRKSVLSADLFRGNKLLLADKQGNVRAIVESKPEEGGDALQK